MEPMSGAYWAKNLTGLFLDDILSAKRTPPGFVEVRPGGSIIWICFHRIGGDQVTAEKYRVSDAGNAVWVPGDSWFSSVYHPKDYDGRCRQGKGLRERVVNLITAGGFRLKRENVKYSRTAEGNDYASKYVRIS